MEFERTMAFRDDDFVATVDNVRIPFISKKDLEMDLTKSAH